MFMHRGHKPMSRCLSPSKKRLGSFDPGYRYIVFVKRPIVYKAFDHTPLVQKIEIPPIIGPEWISIAQTSFAGAENVMCKKRKTCSDNSEILPKPPFDVG